ncbi:hypothetical protein KP509_11G080300 [Ceratopteris richardii]|uniref:CUE domain-containing protein n=1 Tax=Ceratopteris richardii TaxID=49495 RepID=A0A8T2TWF5_CERRI|nr:hypothetical protein KP509_11G080300 [Ceratopteris richardii]KAH7425988.1 hypothetical protein KP509_11G080300 [Ceratopteris richardii]
MEKVLSGMGRLKLNPYAEEFVPAALLKAISTAVNTDSSKLDNTKQEIQSRVLSRTDSDNEQQQDWKVQLPDDIIPDFSIELEENDERLAWLHDHAEESGGLASNMLHLETCEVFDPLEVLTRQFPHVATQSLADILVTNGGNCLLAFDMLTQLELQDDFTSETRLHSQLNFEPAMQNINFGEFSDHLSGPLQSKDTDIQSQRDVVVEGLFTGRSYDSGERHRSTNFTDFASTIDENLSSITSFQGEQELIGQLEPFSGLGGYPAQTGDSLGADILNRVCQSSPVWLEADEIVSNNDAVFWREAHDYERACNAFEQATQACPFGNRTPTRDICQGTNAREPYKKCAYDSWRSHISTKKYIHCKLCK